MDRKMPPNKKGGKAYKKNKCGDSNEPVFIDIQPMQYMARAVRILGNRNVMCYCHDNILRLCHISRRMKGHSDDKKIDVGDIVLISLRDFSSADVASVKRGDIIAKYGGEQIKSLKKEGVYPKLFLKVEGADKFDGNGFGEEIDEKVLQSLTSVAEDGYEFESEEESEEEEETEETKIVDKRDRVNHRKTGRVERDGHEIKQAEKDISLDDL